MRQSNFARLCNTFSEVKLFDDKSLEMPKTDDEIRAAVNEGKKFLPPGYIGKYVKPLMDENFDFVRTSSMVDSYTGDSLFGAIYDHAPDGPFTRAIKCLCAVNSNLYRSYGFGGDRKIADFPPVQQLPPLATFQRRLPSSKTSYYEDEWWPRTLDQYQVLNELSGGQVAVVIMPHCYSDHPALWGLLAHETAGHAVLHAANHLLPQLKKSLGEFLKKELKKEKRLKDTAKEDLIRIWQFWLEESAAHVYGVLNIGPSFGVGILAYLLATSKDMMHLEKERQARMEEKLQQRQAQEKPKMNGSPPNEVDAHPEPPLLQAYVALGAIDKLTDLRKGKRDMYIEELKKCAADPLLSGQVGEEISVKGLMELEQGKTVLVDFTAPVDLMVKYAELVGNHIVKAPLRVLGGRTILDVETWDNEDEEKADDILQRLEKMDGSSIVQAGDDAQLLAGAQRALFQNPTAANLQYINERLFEAFEESFNNDKVWGKVKPWTG